MASIALVTLVSSLELGSTAALVAGTIAGTVGGLIDNAFLYPALASQDKQIERPAILVGPKITQLQLQAASEGTGINNVLGVENRVAGTIIWQGPLQRNVRVDQQTTGGGGGGKGGDDGGDSDVTTTTKTTTLANSIAIAVAAHEIDDILQIWADGRLMYEKLPLTNDIAFSSDKISAKRILTYEWVDQPIFTGSRNAWQGPPPTIRVRKLKSSLIRYISDGAAGGPNLRELMSGIDVVIGGFTNSALNGTKRMTNTFGPSAGEHYFEINEFPIDKFAAIIGEDAGNTITIDQVRPVPDTNIIRTFTLHKGTLVQNADSIIEAVEGAGDTPAFRKIAYVVFENLQLGPFGNRIPQFTFNIKEPATATKGLDDAISDILLQAGLAAGEFDVTALSGTDLRGFATIGPQSTRDKLAPIILSFDLIVTESQGKLVFAFRNATTATTIAADNVAAHEFGQSVQRPFLITDGFQNDLPSEVNVKFIDRELDFQQGSQRARKQDVPNENSQQYNIPLTLSPDEALAIAQCQLYRPWENNRIIQGTLPPSLFTVQENDLIIVPGNGQLYTVMVKKIDRGHNYLIGFEGLIESAATGVQPTTGIGGLNLGLGVQRVRVTSDIIFEIMDIPALIQAHTKEPGYYVVACSADSQDEWVGANIVVSKDGINFTIASEIPVEGFIGRTSIGSVGILPDGQAGTRSSDAASGGPFVEVFMYNGTLSSIGFDEFIRGANRCLIGGEIVAFETATLIDTDTYRLSGFLRGLRGTPVTGHRPNERFVFLSNGLAKFVPINLSLTGTIQEFRGLAIGEEIGNSLGDSFTVQAANLKPLAPVHLRMTRDDDGDATVTWIARSRSLARGFKVKDPSISEEQDSQSVIFSDPSTAVAAQGKLTVAVQPTAGDDFFIGEQAYVFQANGSLTDDDGNIEIGANLAATQSNIVNALNGTGTPGTGYGADTPKNLDVTLAAFGSNESIITSVFADYTGNDIETVETFASGSNFFDAVKLGTETLGVGAEDYRLLDNLAQQSTIYTAAQQTTDGTEPGQKARCKLTVAVQPTVNDELIINLPASDQADDRYKVFFTSIILGGNSLILIGANLAATQTNIEDYFNENLATKGVGWDETLSPNRRPTRAVGVTVGSFSANELILEARAVGTAPHATTLDETFTSGSNFWDDPNMGNELAGIDPDPLTVTVYSVSADVNKGDIVQRTFDF